MRKIILATSAAMALALGAGTAGAEPSAADVRNPSVTDPSATDPSVAPTPTAPTMEPTQTDPTMEPTQTDPTLNPELDAATSGSESFGSSGEQEHVVQKGDTLAEIAERYLGAANEWQRIAEANDIDDPTKLEIGTRLSIPKDDKDS